MEHRMSMAEIQDIMEGREPFPGDPHAEQMERAKKGKCPFCGGDNADYHCVEISEGTGAQQTNCLDCDKDWQENYTLTSIEEIDNE